MRPNNSLVIQQNQGILVPPRAADNILSQVLRAVLYVWKPPPCEGSQLLNDQTLAESSLMSYLIYMEAPTR